jgi:hypothetical protein
LPWSPLLRYHGVCNLSPTAFQARSPVYALFIVHILRKAMDLDWSVNKTLVMSNLQRKYFDLAKYIGSGKEREWDVRAVRWHAQVGSSVLETKKKNVK